jgi:Phosphate transport regulator (distant homolog of PhoU)
MAKKQTEENYFDMFVTSANYACNAANSLLELAKDFTNVEEKANALHEIEHAADQHFHKLYEQLMRSFITPIEREDILLLAQKIDDVIDLIEDIAYKFVILNITSLKDDVIPFINLIVSSCNMMKTALEKFKYFNKSKSISSIIHEISDLEEDGDTFYKDAVKNLFSSKSSDPLDTMKWREIYESLEHCLDACEDVADAMDGVLLKNS